MKTRNFGISELIQSGILITLMTIAFNLGQMIKNFEVKLEDHTTRIAKIEDRVFP